MSNPLRDMAPIGDVVASTLHDLAFSKDSDREYLRAHPGKALSTLTDGMPRLLGRAEALGYRPEIIEGIEAAARAQYVKGSKLCESPIERAMLAGLITGDWGDIGAVPPLVHDASKTGDDALPHAPVVIVPQLAFVRFRLDLGLVIVKQRKLQIVGVECDGKDFHRDDLKDHRRGTYLRSWDIPIFRLSGSQIHDDPINAADRIIVSIHDWWAS